MKDLDILTLVLSSSVFGAIIAAVITKLIDFKLKARELSNNLASKLIDKKVEDFEKVSLIINQASRYQTWLVNTIPELNNFQKRPLVFSNHQELEAFVFNIEDQLKDFLFKSKGLMEVLYDFYDELRILSIHIKRNKLEEQTAIIGILYFERYDQLLNKLYKKTVFDLQEIYKDPSNSINRNQADSIVNRGDYENSLTPTFKDLLNKANRIYKKNKYKDLLSDVQYFLSNYDLRNLNREGDSCLFSGSGSTSMENEDGAIKPPGEGIPDFTK